MIREPSSRSAKLARRLAEISRRRAKREGPPESGAFAGAEALPSGEAPDGIREADPVVRVEVGIEEILPGGVLEGPRGAVFVHERLRSSVERPGSDWGRLRRGRRAAALRSRRPGPAWMWDANEWDGDPDEGGASLGEGDSPWDPSTVTDPFDLAPDVLHAELESLLRTGLERVLFLDLETGGLGSSCVFLAGTMCWNGGDYVLRQYFARHYGEEGALLHHLGEALVAAPALVTFNGKTFDVPLLRDRALRSRVRLRIPDLHVDLLQHSRAAWRGRVPNCRLTTLEAYVCRRRRSGDVRGDEIPALYHDYVRDGLAHRLVPVFHHNLLDVITMDELLRRLV